MQAAHPASNLCVALRFCPVRIWVDCLVQLLSSSLCQPSSYSSTSLTPSRCVHVLACVFACMCMCVCMCMCLRARRLLDAKASSRAITLHSVPVCIPPHRQTQTGTGRHRQTDKHTHTHTHTHTHSLSLSLRLSLTTTIAGTFLKM